METFLWLLKIVGVSLFWLIILHECNSFYVEKVRERFLGRESIEMKKLCALFNQGGVIPDSLVEEVLYMVAQELEISPLLLRPSDRLNVELELPQFDPIKGGLKGLLLSVAKKRGITIDESSLVNLQDYVTYISKYSLL